MKLPRLFCKKPFTWTSGKRSSMPKVFNKKTCTSFRGLHGCIVEERLEEAIDWELRPGGMLVQRRDYSSDLTSSSGPLIKVKVFHGLHQHCITIRAQATFGDMKWLLAQEIGLQPHEQRLLFQGKEKEDGEFLHIAGVMDMAKVILVEDPASKEKKVHELKGSNTVSKACQQAVEEARAEADKIAKQVRRVQSFADHMDSRKVCKSSPIYSNRVVLTLQLETFGSAC